MAFLNAFNRARNIGIPERMPPRRQRPPISYPPPTVWGLPPGRVGVLGGPAQMPPKKPLPWGRGYPPSPEDFERQQRLAHSLAEKERQRQWPHSFLGTFMAILDYLGLLPGKKAEGTGLRAGKPDEEGQSHTPREKEEKHGRWLGPRGKGWGHPKLPETGGETGGDETGGDETGGGGGIDVEKEGEPPEWYTKWMNQPEKTKEELREELERVDKLGGETLWIETPQGTVFPEELREKSKKPATLKESIEQAGSFYPLDSAQTLNPNATLRTNPETGKMEVFVPSGKENYTPASFGAYDVTYEGETPPPPIPQTPAPQQMPTPQTETGEIPPETMGSMLDYLPEDLKELLEKKKKKGEEEEEETEGEGEGGGGE